MFFLNLWVIDRGDIALEGVAFFVCASNDALDVCLTTRSYFDSDRDFINSASFYGRIVAASDISL